MASHPAIRPAAFIRYKFLNSLFLGLSVGAVFVLYTPLSPAVFSAGGLGLAVGTLIVATQYRRILAPAWFFRLSLLVELITLSGVAAVLRASGLTSRQRGAAPPDGVASDCACLSGSGADRYPRRAISCVRCVVWTCAVPNLLFSPELY